VDVEDLALGGACVSLLDAPGVGERVTLAIVSPDLWDPVQMPGRIAWTGSAPDEETQRAGVAFEPTDPRATMALFELIGALG
jgi:hypothetical protein